MQLVPDPTIPTEETGTRHRTADRVSKQGGFPVVSVSQSMRLIALYVDGEQRRPLEGSAAILSRANQALATLERYKLRLDEVAGTLSALEIEDLVTVRDVAVAQRLEMVRRIATEIAEYVVELGTDGRLLALQLDELIAGVEPERELVVRDYVPEPTAKRRARWRKPGARPLTHHAAELLELPKMAKALGYTGSPETLDSRGVAARVPAAGEGAGGCRARSSSGSSSTSVACGDERHPGDAHDAQREQRRHQRPATARRTRRRAWRPSAARRPAVAPRAEQEPSGLRHFPRQTSLSGVSS